MKNRNKLAIALLAALSTMPFTTQAVTIDDIRIIGQYVETNNHDLLHRELNDAAAEIGSCTQDDVINILRELEGIAYVVEQAKTGQTISFIDNTTATMIDQMLPQIVSNIDETIAENKTVKNIATRIMQKLALVN